MRARKGQKSWRNNLYLASICRLFQVESPSIFSRSGSLTGSQFLEEVCWERGGVGVNFFKGGYSFHINKNQNLKYLITKKVYKQSLQG